MQLFESCQKVELKLSNLVTAVVCQNFVVALLLLLFAVELFDYVVDGEPAILS